RLSLGGAGRRMSSRSPAPTPAKWTTSVTCCRDAWRSRWTTEPNGSLDQATRSTCRQVTTPGSSATRRACCSTSADSRGTRRLAERGSIGRAARLRPLDGAVSLKKRLFAATYDRMSASTEEAGLRDRRRELLAQAHGRVLEIGGGTGANLPFYGAAVSSLTVTEPEVAVGRRLGRPGDGPGRPVGVGRASRRK